MKKEKMSFFKKMFLVLTDFRSYPFLIKYEKFYKSFKQVIQGQMSSLLIKYLNNDNT